MSAGREDDSAPPPWWRRAIDRRGTLSAQIFSSSNRFAFSVLNVEVRAMMAGLEAEVAAVSFKINFEKEKNKYENQDRRYIGSYLREELQNTIHARVFSPILHEPDPDWESRDFSSSGGFRPKPDLQGVAAGGRDCGRTTGQL